MNDVFVETIFEETLVTGANNDGANPYGGLILSDNIVYGTTEQGGSSRKGTVFAVTTDGTGPSTSVIFSRSSNESSKCLSVLVEMRSLKNTSNQQKAISSE